MAHKRNGLTIGYHVGLKLLSVGLLPVLSANNKKRSFKTLPVKYMLSGEYFRCSVIPLSS